MCRLILVKVINIKLRENFFTRFLRHYCTQPPTPQKISRTFSRWNAYVNHKVPTLRIITVMITLCHISFFFMVQEPPLGRVFTIVEASRYQKHHTSKDSPGRVISPTQGPLPDSTQQSEKTDLDVSGWIRTRKPNKQKSPDPSLRPHDHWDRLPVS